MSYRITGLRIEEFAELLAADAATLAARGVISVVADDPAGYPCRVTLAHAAVGERLLLLNYEHQPAPTPYRASHAIFVRAGARQTYDDIDTLPDVMRVRPLSIRAFDARHHMVDADLIAGSDAETLILPMLARPEVAYLQAHYAKRGCYAARIERA